MSQELGIIHGFSDKSLGNMALSRGSRQVSLNNRNNFMEKINLDVSSILLEPEITQGTNLLTLMDDNTKKRHTDSHSKFPLEIIGKGYDGIITDNKNVTLFLCVADCAPVLFYDSVQKVIAIVHAGLLGAVAGVARHTVEVMQRVFGVNSANVRVTIGPCIGKQSFDITRSNMWNNVLVKFDARKFLPESLFNKQGSKLFFDLPLCIKMDLIGAGVAPENIETSGLCTIRDGSHFFSHYGAGAKGSEHQKLEGRFASAIKLKLT